MEKAVRLLQNRTRFVLFPLHDYVVLVTLPFPFFQDPPASRVRTSAAVFLHKDSANEVQKRSFDDACEALKPAAELLVKGLRRLPADISHLRDSLKATAAFKKFLRLRIYKDVTATTVAKRGDADNLRAKLEVTRAFSRKAGAAGAGTGSESESQRQEREEGVNLDFEHGYQSPAYGAAPAAPAACKLVCTRMFHGWSLTPTLVFARVALSGCRSSPCSHVCTCRC